MTRAASLDLGVTGNCIISALIDREARVVWSCLPRLDGDPVFHALVDDGAASGRGYWSIELAGFERSEQEYVANTAVLVTRLFSSNGSAVEVTDFCPRFEREGRMFRPQMLVRRVRSIAGTPRICVKLRPSFEYGALRPEITHGSNHIRYVSPDRVLRLTTDAPVSYVLGETPFLLEAEASFVLGADESLSDGTGAMARAFQEHTEAHWRQWTRRLAIPPEWQDAVLRAAITLKLCTFEETGAIVAAMTTSIPEAPGSGAQLGLPLLLAARRVLRRAGAQLAVRSRHHGALPALPRQHRRPGAGRAPATGVRHRARTPPRRARSDDARRLSRHGAGPRGQPGVRASPARRLRQRRARHRAGFLRPAPAAAADGA